MADQWILESILCSPTHSLYRQYTDTPPPLFTWILRIQIQVIMLAWQAPHKPSYLPNMSLIIFLKVRLFSMLGRKIQKVLWFHNADFELDLYLGWLRWEGILWQLALPFCGWKYDWVKQQVEYSIHNSLCVSYFSAAEKKCYDRSNLQKEQFIWTYGFREIRVHHDVEASSRHGMTTGKGNWSSHPQHEAE